MQWAGTGQERKALSRHPVLATSNVDEAHDAVERIYLRHNLSSADPRAMAMTLNAFEHRICTVGFLTYGSPVRVAMPPSEDCYHVNLTTQGQTSAARPDGAHTTTLADVSGVILQPNRVNVVDWEAGAEQLILKIPTTSLRSYLADVLGRRVIGDVDFAFSLDLTTPAGCTLYETVKFLARELDRPGSPVTMPIVLEPLENAILAQLLLAAPNAFSDALAAPVGSEPCERRLKVAVDYMHAHADEPLTPTALARISGLGLRTLHAAFMHQFGTSPMAYLRQLRLERARADLVRSQQGVIEVAMRWGFFHPSRFAQQYAQRFGELPSATVRRHSG